MNASHAGLPRIADSFASSVRPVLTGTLGAVSAAHPLATAAGQLMLTRGGSAVDATIAAQAVLCVLAPDACGLGGDVFGLVREADGVTTAVNGAGAAPLGLKGAANDGGGSVTVPGLVDAWDQMAERWGRLPFAAVLDPAIQLARNGVRISPRLRRSVDEQRTRLVAGGAATWGIVKAAEGDTVVQNELASLLARISKERAAAFYAGSIGETIARVVQDRGGTLSRADLSAHHTIFAHPVATKWRGLNVFTQPPMSQGILLSMVLNSLETLGGVPDHLLSHACVELTNASFAFRDRVGEGTALLKESLAIDVSKASRKGGPRAYLHTAGVAAADRFGMTVSSLVSVFDDFGSGVFVPQGGFVLNNRAGGFTSGPNAPEPGKRPVHTLAPILIDTPRGPIAMATPGADGQIQTLLQVLVAAFRQGLDLASAVSAPRWRSENGRLLVEKGHPDLKTFKDLGHDVECIEAGHLKFGAVVMAAKFDGAPACLADWRRETWAGVV